MKKSETEKINQKTNISKKQHINNTRNTDASCDETITKTSSIIHCYRLFKKTYYEFAYLFSIQNYAELPLGKLYAVQRFLNCLSASCPKRLQILFSNALYFLQKFNSFNINLVGLTGRQKI